MGRGASLRRVIGCMALAAIAAIASGGTAAAATAATVKPVISKVSFSTSGDSIQPILTVVGKNFGAQPPKGFPDGSSSCGSFSGNGDTYGTTGLWFKDVSENWRAGYSSNTGTGQDCVGVILTKWSTAKVVFELGSAYGSRVPPITCKDKYTLELKAAVHSGSADINC